MVKTLAQHKELVSIAKAKGVLLQIEVHKRFDPIYNDARQRIQSLGTFGYFTSFIRAAVHAPRAPAERSRRPVVTRFAPSPTGYLHIGGARTALFNYLFAKHHGGQFLMRIEDTDLERHNEAAVDAILQGMAWLGTPHDGQIVRQRERCGEPGGSGGGWVAGGSCVCFGAAANAGCSPEKFFACFDLCWCNVCFAGRHKEVAMELLKNGGAYKCYCSKEELEAMRQEAETQKVAFRYPGKCRRLPPDACPPAGRQPVDGVMGLIEIPNKDVDDFIILRADETPTYLLAVVVDDHDMGVTQVIRGSDHIGNTARQIAVFQNMNWELPDFAHLPLIHGPDGKKLSSLRRVETSLRLLGLGAASARPRRARRRCAEENAAGQPPPRKRHGATGLEEFEAKGYLPEAIRNYLARLSWSHGDDEIFSTKQAIEWRGEHLAGAPCFDFDKLNGLNQHYIKEADAGRLYEIVEKIFPEVKAFEQKFRDPRVANMLKVRAKTLIEYKQAADFIMAQRPLEVSKAAAKDLGDQLHLESLAEDLQTFGSDRTGSTPTEAVCETVPPEDDSKALEVYIKGLVVAKEMKLGAFAKPIRAALTGSTASPGLFEVIWAIGHQEAVARLRDAAAGKFKVADLPCSDRSSQASAAFTAPTRAPLWTGKGAERRRVAGGVPRAVAGQWRSTVSFLVGAEAGISSDISYYLNSHHVDFHVWAMQGIAKPVSVYATASTGVAEKILGRSCEDTITLTVTWKNSTGSSGHATYTSSWTASKSDVHSQQRFFCQMERAEVTVDQAHRGYYVAEDDVGFNSCNPLFIRNKPDG
eukprot:g32917.t1